ncbi:TPA: hypothetical protein P0E29_001657 [Vibrio harveyi]|nr:hypothetical protein [Vibrio harveyi]
MDTCKVALRVYQYTAIVRVLSSYSHRTATNTLDFHECVIDEVPVPI